MSDRIDLPPAPESVAAARAWVVGVVEPVVGPEEAATVSLLVSEVVTNVVLHARTACGLSVRRVGDHLRIEASDRCDRLPDSVPSDDPLASSGRGMMLIEALSSSNGVIANADGGKTVWFEVPLRTDGI